MINENITRQPQTWWCVINGGNVNLWQVMNEFICERERVVISLGRITKCVCGHLYVCSTMANFVIFFLKLIGRILGCNSSSRASKFPPGVLSIA